MPPRVLSLLVIALISTHLRAGENWPGFRGPTGQGVTDEKNLPRTWGGKSAENVLWKVPLPGAEPGNKPDHNQASPIVWKDRVFVSMVYWPKDVDKAESPEHRVACYAVADGKKLWDVDAKPGPWKLKDFRGGYSAPTPCTDGERVYALFGSSVIAALDFDGKEVWRKEILPIAWDVAIGTSPVMYKGTVLVLADGTKPDKSRLIAFDAKTGDVAWEKARPKSNFSHSTPLLIEVAKKPQLVIASSNQLQGIDPADGRIVWWANAKGDVPTPAFGGGIVYSEDGRGGPGIAVDPNAEGDVTAKIKWKTTPVPEGYSSPTIAGEFIYRMHNPGILKCLKSSTGEAVYSERLPTGVDQSASPILTPENELLFATGGKSIVVPVGPKFEIKHTNDLGDGSSASAVVAGGKLFIKGAKFLHCIGTK